MAIQNKRKKLLYVLLGITVFAVLSGVVGVQYVKYQFFSDSPNTLTLVGDRHPIPFEWVEQKYDEYTEPHNAILFPVFVPGIERQLYMQFDTGSPSTFLRSGAMASLKERGVEFELFEQDEQTRVKKFELNVGGNRILLESGHVRKRNIAIKWDDPDSINIIGSIGADIIDKSIVEIDFAAQEMRLYERRPDSLNALGGFSPFGFKGRRIMLPAVIRGVEMELFYDSGCSAFGLFTSKYHFDCYSDESSESIRYNANRFGDPVPINHRVCDLAVHFGGVELPLKRVSYVEQYTDLQSAIGGFINGGFFGNKSLLESTLILDAISNEFLVVPPDDKESAPLSSNIDQ